MDNNMKFRGDNRMKGKIFFALLLWNWKQGPIIPLNIKKENYRAKRFIILGIILFMQLFTFACKSYNKRPIKKYEIINSTTNRIDDPDRFFGEEYEEIRLKIQNLNKKSKKINPQDAKKQMIGLALSGGGIRANSFHWGILSGLHNKKILSKISYISSASGGSWANAGYKTSELSDDELFKSIKEGVKDPYSSYSKNRILNKLFNKYFNNSILFKEGSIDYWKGLIKENVLDGKDYFIQDINDAGKNFSKQRPEAIFSLSHNVPLTYFGFARQNKRNFPVEVTKNGITSIADCGSAEWYCNWVFDITNFSKKGFSVDLRVSPETKQTRINISLASVLAASSGVIRQILNRKLSFDEYFIDNREFRRSYDFSDGGHSENLASLPLIERHLPVIIIIDIGEDKDYIFDDYHILRSQSKKLLNTDVSLKEDEMKSLAGCQTNCNPILHGSYILRDVNIPAKILYVKPKVGRNLSYENFFKSIEYTHPHVYNYFNEKENFGNFPMDETFDNEYEMERILAYFLLGQYISENYLGKVIN